MSAPIVVATDFSNGAAVALERAAHLAKVRQVPLYVLHVFDDGIWASLAGVYASAAWYGADPALTTRQRLADLAGDLALRHDIDARPASASGAAAEAIARFASDVDAGLVVVGKQGEHWIADAVLGETALKLSKSSALPVLVANEQTPARIERIVIATDFSPNAFRAALAALRWFPEADKQLLNAYSVQFEGRMRLAGASEDDIAVYRNLERTRAEAGMRVFADRLEPADNLTSLVVSGFPAATVLSAAARDVDLVVMGRHGGSGIEELLLGSVTRNVLYHAACDVLLVP